MCRSLGRSQTAEPVGTPGGDDMAGLARFVRWPSSPASPTQPALPPSSWRGTPAQDAEERYVICAVRWAGAGGAGRTSAIAQRSVELPTRSPISFFIVARGNLDRLNCSKRASCSSVATLTNCSYSSLHGTGGELSGRCLVGSTVRAQRSVRTPSCPSRSASSAVLASRRPPDPPDDASPPHPRSGRPHHPPRPCLAPCASTSRMHVLCSLPCCVLRAGRLFTRGRGARGSGACFARTRVEILS
jgi:hypothetical protein